MNLEKLTGNESGIILYGDKTVAAVNWCNMGDDMFPMLSPFGGEMIGWPEERPFDNVKHKRVHDWRELLPGSVWLTEETDEDGNRIADTDLDIVYDKYQDIARACLDPDYCGGDFEANVYTLADGRIIIAPDMWN